MLVAEYQPALKPPSESEDLEHPDWVSSASGADTAFVTGCYDGTLRLYSPEGKQFSTTIAHKKPITSVSMSQVATATGSADLIASASKDCTVKLWIGDSNHSDEVLTQVGLGAGHEAAVQCVALSPSNALLASSAWDGEVRVWDIEAPTAAAVDASESGADVRVGSGSGAGAGAGTGAGAPSSTKRRRTRSASKESMGSRARVSVGITDLSSTLSLSTTTQCVTSVVWTDTNRLVTAGYDHVIRLYDVESGGNVLQSLVRCVLYVMHATVGHACLILAWDFVLSSSHLTDW